MLVNVLFDLHCDNADEHSRAEIVAIVIAAQPQLDAQVLVEASGPQALAMVHEVASLVTAQKAGTTRGNPDPWAFRTYPQNPAMWKAMVPAELYEEVYLAGPPVPCPLDLIVVARLKAAVPCRASKLGMRASAAAGEKEQFLDTCWIYNFLTIH